MQTQTVCIVRESSDVGVARRKAAQIATEAGFDETETSRVALLATELSTNLVRHAGGGMLLLQIMHTSGGIELELLSIDSGPGMNVQECLRDGFSSAGTAGQGLGAIKRLSHEFDAYSQVGKGSVVMSRLRQKSEDMTVQKSKWRWGAVSIPVPGETANGDAWSLRAEGDAISVMMADGLGHGPLAAEASQAAVGVFQQGEFGALTSFFTRAHGMLRSTRGAAVAAALCPSTEDSMQFVGVGNISSSMVSRDGSSRHLMSHNGTVGAQMRPAQMLKYDWKAGDRLVLHSDGLTTRWSYKDYPELYNYHPAILSALLYRDHVRGKDDATVLVLERPV